MGKKYKHLIERIGAIENLRDAYERTARGKRSTFGFLEFKEYAHANLALMSEAILDGAWVQGPYREFTVYEPKSRLISALDFKDRLAQHALVNIIGPIFDKTLMPQTFACRHGMGTHAGVRFVQAGLRRTQAKYFLKTDYSKFFYSIDRPILHDMIERKISCKPTLKLIRAMVPNTGRGVPIGSLTSQIFANVYGNAVDRLIHFDLGHRCWARYMDDIVILDNDLGRLKETFRAIEMHAKDVLKLSISKWNASAVSRGINFLGYRIWPTHKLLRKDSVLRAKRKIKGATSGAAIPRRWTGFWRPGPATLGGRIPTTSSLTWRLSMASPLINTRADLDSIVGTPEHAAFIAMLKGSMTQRHNVAVYPEGYGQPGYVGPAVEPVWVDSEDLGTVERFGFTKDEILAL